MLVSIIVPTFNEENRIAATLDALEKLSGNKQILVVDGGSSDRTIELARLRNVTVLDAPRGRGPQMHAAAVHATGDVLWFIHADTVPSRNALDEIRRALDNQSVVGGNFGLSFEGDSRRARFMTNIYPMLRRLRLCFGDSGIFVRRSVYQTIGGFGQLALFEDLDLLRRVRRSGRFVHLPARLVTSSRRFEQRNFACVWLQWITLQVLYWCGVSPNLLARWYSHVR